MFCDIVIPFHLLNNYQRKPPFYLKWGLRDTQNIVTFLKTVCCIYIDNINKKSYYMFKHVIIGGVMKLVGKEASKN